jgi:hypothetical protein
VGRRRRRGTCVGGGGAHVIYSFIYDDDLPIGFIGESSIIHSFLLG